MSQYVIQTRYSPGNGSAVIRHVYGTYATRARATTACKKIIREVLAEALFAERHFEPSIEAHVVRLTTIGDET